MNYLFFAHENSSALQFFNSYFGFGETRTICYESEPNLGDTANTQLEVIETESKNSDEGVGKMKKEISSALDLWKNSTGENFPLSDSETALIRSQKIEDNKYTRKALQLISGKILGDIIILAQETDNATYGNTSAKQVLEEKGISLKSPEKEVVVPSKKMMGQFPGSKNLVSTYGLDFVFPEDAEKEYNNLKNSLDDISPNDLYAEKKTAKIKEDMRKCSPEYIKEHYSEIEVAQEVIDNFEENS